MDYENINNAVNNILLYGDAWAYNTIKEALIEEVEIPELNKILQKAIIQSKFNESARELIKEAISNECSINLEPIINHITTPSYNTQELTEILIKAIDHNYELNLNELIDSVINENNNHALKVLTYAMKNHYTIEWLDEAIKPAIEDENENAQKLLLKAIEHHYEIEGIESIIKPAIEDENENAYELLCKAVLTNYPIKLDALEGNNHWKAQSILRVKKNR